MSTWMVAMRKKTVIEKWTETWKINKFSNLNFEVKLLRLPFNFPTLFPLSPTCQRARESQQHRKSIFLQQQKNSSKLSSIFCSILYYFSITQNTKRRLLWWGHKDGRGGSEKEKKCYDINPKKKVHLKAILITKVCIFCVCSRRVFLLGARLWSSSFFSFLSSCCCCCYCRCVRFRRRLNFFFLSSLIFLLS